MVAESLGDSSTGQITAPSGRIEATGYPFSTSGFSTSSPNNFYPGPENVYLSIAGNTNGWSNAEILAVVDAAHKGLFEDFTVPGRGHRSTYMYEMYKEIGIGTATGTDQNASNQTRDSMYLVQNFGNSSIVTNGILTGLAYNDHDNNNFFTPARTPTSESITGLTVQARQGGITVASVAAFETGGYSLPLAAGSYQIFFRTANATEHSAGTVVMGADNVEQQYDRLWHQPYLSVVQRSYELAQQWTDECGGHHRHSCREHHRGHCRAESRYRGGHGHDHRRS